MVLKELVFYYDVICPYAYVASKLVKEIAERTGATLKWRPVLLGGIYSLIKPKEVAKARPAQTMPPAKLLVLERDLRRLFKRNGLTAAPHKGVPDLSSLNAMRLIVSSPNESSELRQKITHALYDAVWVHKRDVGDIEVLKSITKEVNWDVNVEDVVLKNTTNAREALFENTKQSVDRGAFGVPSFWVNEKLFFGTDRLFFVEKELGVAAAQPLRVQPIPINPDRPRKLTIYHDVSSPFCNIGMHKVDDLLANCRPLKIDVEYVPVLLGALFKAIGTPEVPIRGAPKNKVDFAVRDLKMWINHLGMKSVAIPSNFPLMSITVQRLLVAFNDDAKLRKLLYDAAYNQQANLTYPKVIVKVLNENGYNGLEMIEKTQDPAIKEQLKANTARAIENGACGMPSFQVNDGPIIWGQDRMNEVADVLCGATDVELYSNL